MITVDLGIWASGADKDTSRDTIVFSGRLSSSSSLPIVFLFHCTFPLYNLLISTLPSCPFLFCPSFCVSVSLISFLIPFFIPFSVCFPFCFPPFLCPVCLLFSPPFISSHFYDMSYSDCIFDYIFCSSSDTRVLYSSFCQPCAEAFITHTETI